MKWRSIAYTLGLIVGGSLFLWQLLIAAQALTAQVVRVERLWLAGVAVGVLILGTGLQISGWILTMRELGARMSWREGVRGYVLPFLARYIPGMVWGYLSRSHWLETRYGTPATVANAGSIIEVLGLIAAAGLVMVVGGVMAATLPIVLGGLLSILAVIAGLGLANWLAARSELALPGWLKTIVESLRSALAAVTAGRVLRVVPWYLGLWLSYGVAVWLSLGIVADLTAWTLPVATYSFAAAWVIGFVVVILPAGLGLRESTLAGLLVLFASLSPAAAAVVAVFARAYILLAELTFVVIGSVFARRRE